LTVHGLKEATADDVSVGEVLQALLNEAAELIEDYPEHGRGPCCLVLGWTQAGRPLHLVVTHPPNVAVITVYVPDQVKWIDYRVRR